MAKQSGFRNVCYFLIALLWLTAGCKIERKKAAPTKVSPNFIVIFCDDLGYGDLGIFGNPNIRTPNLDQLAHEGQKWTNFYVAANVCTPSRAALLTGRFPVRSGMYSDNRRVLFPNSARGLPESEITIAEILKRKNYATAAVGKWHLGHLPEYLPINHGFDSYYGIPYSNDMDRTDGIDHYQGSIDPKIEYFQVPLLRNQKEVERPADQRTITRRYTEEAVKFIKENKENPFFLYLAHSMPHVPLFASEKFSGKSKRGIYGDVIEEIDWSAGEIVKILKEEGLADNTLVVFTSDNGPWVTFKDHGGSAGPLFGAKGTGYEGGVRVPTIFWWPGKIGPSVISDIGSTLDLLPTLSSMANIDLPGDREYDGYDLSVTLLQKEKSPREEMLYYHGSLIFAARKGPFKLHYYENNPEGYPERIRPLAKFKLFNLYLDPGEQYDLADDHPEIIAEISDLVESHKANVEIAETLLEKRIE